MDSPWNPENWAKLLSVYGPSGAALLVLIVGVKIAGGALKKSAPGSRRMYQWIYSANWLVFFALLAVSVICWVVSLRPESAIRGTFENLQGSESIYTKDVSTQYRLYLHKVYESSGGYDFDWRLVSAKPLAEGAKVHIVFDQSTPGSERFADYEIPIAPSFYKDEVRIAYRRTDGALLLSCSGKTATLQRAPEAVASDAREPWSFLVGTAYAQGTMAPPQTETRLESNDPIIRRQARQEIAKQGPSALPWIQQTLSDPRSSYRLRLGAISALNQVGGVRSETLAPAALLAIVDASADGDSALLLEGRRFLQRAPSWSLARTFDRRWAQAVFGPPGQRTRLSRSGLELYHGLGFAEERLYGSRRPQDRPHFALSVSAYRRAWELRASALPADRKWFAKALWGWGNVLHDRSWIERRGDGSRDLQWVREAQAKFREFVQQVSVLGTAASMYAEQSRCASRYVANPVPESLGPCAGRLD